MERLRDVVVVGAGPAGTTAALSLSQRGHDVVLLDEARFPRDKICGEALSPGAWRLLERLGAATTIIRAGAYPLSGMKLCAPDGTTFEGRYDGGRTTGFALERRVLDSLLLERTRAAGVEVREGVRVTSLLMNGDAVGGVTVVHDGQEGHIPARLVIGADGRRSRVGRGLGLLREAPGPRRFAVRGHWDGIPGLSSFGEMHVGRGGYCGLAPLGPRTANVTFVLPQRELREAGGDLTSFYRATLPRWPKVWERLREAQLRAAPRAIGPLALEAKRVYAPGALLVGDATGFLDPFTGEGIALGLRSALLASEVAHEALAGRSSLAGYEQRHRLIVREKFRFNRIIQWIVAHPWAANAAARALVRRPGLADRLVGIAGDCEPERAEEGWDRVWGLLWGR